MSESAIIIGASAGLGRAIAERLAASGWDLVVAARTAPDLEKLATELETAHSVRVTALPIDVTASDSALSAFLDAAAVAVPDPDAVIIPAGTVAPVDVGVDDWATMGEMIAANMTGVMKLGGHFAGRFEDRDSGTLVLFSSIAAGAPRRNNVAYSAAKAGLESFAKSMQHRLGSSQAAVQLYRLGYVDTRLAEGQDLKLKPADPEKVASRVVEGLGGRSCTVFEPRYWNVIVRGLRVLPRSVYNRLDF